MWCSGLNGFSQANLSLRRVSFQTSQGAQQPSPSVPKTKSGISSDQTHLRVSDQVAAAVPQLRKLQPNPSALFHLVFRSC